MGLVTGNVEQMARKKLKLFKIKDMKLGDCFKFGGFGEESYNRADLVRNALQRAQEYGWDGKKSYVIGDTPLDIKSALEAGDISKQIIPIGMTTGRYKGFMLEKAGARYVSDSLIELSNLI